MTDKPVSNSFDYTPVRVLDGFVLDPAGCGARDLGLTASTTSRVVIVKRQGRFVLCMTRTSSFDDAEIRRVVHDLGQLYLDVSGKHSIDDFENDLVQLVISPVCRSCRHFSDCVACYQESPGSFFLDDDAWLRAEMGKMKGRLLDVGMGRAPYLDAFASGIKDGSLEFHGLDPETGVPDDDPGISSRVVLYEGHIEGFSGLTFNHVLALRSLNHFEDVDRALRRICDCVAPGGTVLLVESVALPMVRSKVHSDASHAASVGGFQHLRNWDSYQTLERIEGRLPLEIVFHRPISRDTCDQWILKLRRR